ncbi:MAG: glycerol-3-phosphate dehydrogenase [Chloroflexota bacterium]
MNESTASGAVIDLLVIGGGINGVGIARDAAGRGLSVTLCERGDLGGATSWTSSKLLHGGLRYLERYEFRLVHDALAEREVLMDAAPHLIRPLPTVLPHDSTLRPIWMIRAGLFLYDHLARRKTLPGSRGIDFRTHKAGEPLRPEREKGFLYYDCQVDDARLVILNAIDARQRGAQILPRTSCVHAERRGRVWHATLQDACTGEERQVHARLIINATGPWAENVARHVLGLKPRYHSHPVKGSHIVTRKLYEGEHAYILQSEDRRVVFVLPFENEYTIIGTTDTEYSGDLANPTIDPDEVDYLSHVVNRYFARPVQPDDIIWTYSGIRPLYDDGSADPSSITRDYLLEPHPKRGEPPAAPAVTIWGGKLTGYRLLAEDVLARVLRFFPKMEERWTATAPLPGGNLQPAPFDTFQKMVRQVYPWLPADLARDYAHRYGARIHTMLGNVDSMDRLGAELSPGLYEREVSYLVREEWATSADDILWRRTKLGLRATPDSVEVLRSWLEQYRSSSPTST